MPYLFIGGSWDGQRRTVLGKPPERIRAMCERPPVFDEDCDYEEYRLHGFQVAGVDFLVYTHGWMDAAIIMQRLLDRYTAENKA